MSTNGVFLVEVKSRRIKSNLPELRLLSESAGYTVLKEFHQARHCDSAYCLGRGRAEEIAEEARSSLPVKIIFNNRLKPIQKYNLTKLFATEVIDRFQLILEIFTKRAGTVEAKCQIELAKLQYELPMARENVKLARLGELPGFHGLGKYQVDVYTLMIKKRISYLKKQLDEISERKSRNRLQRRKESLFSIALSGYTYAGKTTLFNRLTNETLPIGSSLFTTVSTTTRSLVVSDRKVLISDTVGFIDNLPHLLVESFYSTLDEVALADKVILVLDASEPPAEFSRKLKTCVSTLTQIGVFSNSIMPVLNKADIAQNMEEYVNEVKELLGSRPFGISAKTGEGIPELMNGILAVLPEYELISLKVPISKNISSLVSWAFNETDVKSIKYEGDSVSFKLSMNPPSIATLKNLLSGVEGVEMTILEPARQT
jgi:GTP-binding protein HflX